VKMKAFCEEQTWKQFFADWPLFFFATLDAHAEQVRAGFDVKGS